MIADPRRRPFLDKLATSAHLPWQIGQEGFCSTLTFPDLSHTGIQTAYSPPIIPTTTPSNRMTRIFKNAAFLESLSFERPRAELRFRKEFFKRAHNVFFNKVLVELDEQKRERRERREKIWTQGKRQLGFADAFNVGSISLMGDKDMVKEGESGFESIEFDDSYAEDFEGEVAKKIPVVHEAGAEEGGGGGGGDNVECSASLVVPATNPPSPPLPKRNLQISTSIAASSPSLSPTTSPINISHSKLPRLTSATLLRESLSRASTAQSNRQASNKSRASSKPSTSRPNPNPSPSSNSIPGSTPSRQRRPFSRMTFFECLLDTLPVPDPHAPRYGQLQSPIRVTQRTASTTAEFDFEGRRKETGTAMGVAGALSILSPVVAPNRSSERIGTASPTNRQAQLLSRSSATANSNSAPLAGVPALDSTQDNPHDSLQGSSGFASFFGPSEGSGSRSALGLSLPLETVLPPEEESVELDTLEIENLGLAKWTVESVNRCLMGDKPRKIKDYR